MRKLVSAITLALALGAGLVVAGPAHAAVTPAPAPQRVEITIPMHVVGFDAAVARAHGYVIRTDAHGREYSVKAGASPDVTPDNLVWGLCGFSYLYYNALGNSKVEVNTGFAVAGLAVIYWWKYWMQDLGGTSSHIHSGGLDFQSSWDTTDTWPGMTPGPSTAWVDTGSDAILSSGAVCSSGGPSDTTTIY